MSRQSQIKIHLGAIVREFKHHVGSWKRIIFHTKGIFRAVLAQ